MSEQAGKLEGTPLPTVVYLLTDEEMTSALIIAVKGFLRKIAIPRRRYLAWLYDQIESADAIVHDRAGNPVNILDLKDWEQFERDHFDVWVRDWIQVRERHYKPRIRKESRERIRLLVTALRVIFASSVTWIHGDRTGGF